MDSSLIEERMESHGNPVINMVRISDAWTAILGHAVEAHEVALCMAALHLVRDAAGVHDDNHLRHAEGYIDIARRLQS